MYKENIPLKNTTGRIKCRIFKNCSLALPCYEKKNPHSAAETIPKLTVH